MVHKEPFEIKKLEVGSFENNCYLLICLKSQEAIIIDPAADAEKIIKTSKELKVKYILITHGHFDHIAALERVKKATRTPVGIHSFDSSALPSPPDFYLKDDDLIHFGQCTAKIIHTPGHTPGGPGNTEIPGANRRQIER